MSANTTIHVGFWTNWSKGQVKGSTLTMTNSNAAVLIAALAIFIQLAGGRSWNIICFMAHQLRTTRRPRDGLYHQQQATLRNNNSDVNALWEFARIGWAWNDHSINSTRRSSILVMTAVLHLIAFAAAGILASNITIVGSEVLLARSPYCGAWEPMEGNSPEGADMGVTSSSLGHFTGFTSYQRTSVHASSQYVQNCPNEAESLPECNVLARTRLKYEVSRAQCPFNDICLGPANSTISMDTGPLDSRSDLGVNSPNKDRITWRKNATCVPITTTGYTASGNSSFSISQIQQLSGEPMRDDLTLAFNYTAAYYGRRHLNISSFGLSDSALRNATYIYTNFRDIATWYHNDRVSSYEIYGAVADYTRGFVPIDAIATPNVTLTIAFASFYGTYTSPSNDLWLSAHLPLPRTQYLDNGEDGATITQFGFDNPVTALACNEQLQYCNPTKNGSVERCSPFLSVNNMIMWIAAGKLTELFDTDRQVQIAETIMEPVTRSSIYDVIRALDSSLLADELSSDGMSLPPADNQWEIEAKNWFSISLTNIQRLLVDYSTGPPSQFTQFVPRNQAENVTTTKWLCSNQMIRRNDFTNFSSLAVFLIFGLGTIILLTSFWVESVVGWVRMKRKRGEWRQRAWWMEEALQLQMKAFMSVGITDWKFTAIDRVPVNARDTTWTTLGDCEDAVSPGDEKYSERARERDEVWYSQGDKDGVNVRVFLGSASGSEDIRGAKRTRSNSV